jgi:4-oxalomesaconate hydratase
MSKVTRREFTTLAAVLATSGSAASAATRPDQGPVPGIAPPPGTKPRVLAVVAHPADFCSRAGGTLIKHVKAGHAVRVIWLTHGVTDESQALYQKRPGISADEVRRIREAEAFAAAAIVGAEGRMLGYSDDPIKITPDRMETLAKEIADFKPSIILTHWKEVTYGSHWITGQSVITAAQMAHGSWNLQFFEPNIGSATRVGFLPDHYVDITDVFDQKIAALKALASQPNLVDQYSACNRWRGLECSRQYAEGFVWWAPQPTVENLLD